MFINKRSSLFLEYQIKGKGFSKQWKSQYGEEKLSGVDPITIPAHHMENKELDRDLQDQENGILCWAQFLICKD